jgi:hypothetical protein
VDVDFGHTPGFISAKIALLVDRYHMTLDEVAALTDYQIVHIYYHKRNKEGGIAFPELPVESRDDTFEETMIGLKQMQPLMKPELYEEAVRKVRVKFGKEASGGEGQGQEQ